MVNFENYETSLHTSTIDEIFDDMDYYHNHLLIDYRGLKMYHERSVRQNTLKLK